MQRFLIGGLAAFVVAVGLAGASCSPSPLGPSNASPEHATPASKTASLDETGTTSGFPTWNEGGASGDFRIHPTSGLAPLTVHVNMCHSTDPRAGTSLHYHVVWGDGSDDRGFCRFDHVYSRTGQFAATACVWDEIPAHYPGACDAFHVDATSAQPAPTTCRTQSGGSVIAQTVFFTVTPGDVVTASSPSASLFITCPGGAPVPGFGSVSTTCTTSGSVQVLFQASTPFTYTATACP